MRSSNQFPERPGALPIGDVHPNALGYSVIAADVAGPNAVLEPSTWAMMVVGLLAMVG